MEIADKIKTDYPNVGQIDIYFGAPDARFSKHWWAFAKVVSGIHVGRLYGQPLRMAHTLSNLTVNGKYETPGIGAC